MTAHPTHPGLRHTGSAAFATPRRLFPPTVRAAFGHASRPAVLFVVALVLLFVDAGRGFGDWLWAIALFALGMTHGAYDLAAMHAASRSVRTTALRFALYTLVMGACAGAFALAPTPTLVAFLLLSAHHFGLSDSVWTRGRRPASIADNAAGLSRGLVVICSPFVFSPVEAWRPFAELGLLAGGAWWPEPQMAAAVAGALVLACMTYALARALRGNRPAALEETGTLVGALMLAAVAHPLVAIGVYFLVVHALGHCMRAYVPGRPAARPGLRNLWLVQRRSLILLAPSIAMTLALVPLFDQPSVRSIALAFLLFCVVATLPHHLLWLRPARI